MKKYTFGHMTLAMVVGMLLMGTVLTVVPREYQRFTPEHAAAQTVTVPTEVKNPFEVQHHASLSSRYSVEKIHVFGRETWVLYDQEMNTQFITDAEFNHREWTGVTPLCPP